MKKEECTHPDGLGPRWVRNRQDGLECGLCKAAFRMNEDSLLVPMADEEPREEPGDGMTTSQTEEMEKVLGALECPEVECDEDASDHCVDFMSYARAAYKLGMEAGRRYDPSEDDT